MAACFPDDFGLVCAEFGFVGGLPDFGHRPIAQQSRATLTLILASSHTIISFGPSGFLNDL